MYYIQSEFRRKDGKRHRCIIYNLSEKERRIEVERSLRKKPEKVLFAIEVAGKPNSTPS